MSKLYIVGTPIGNLGDISPRALETLSTCDFIAAEDTRVTLKLLNHFGIKKPMLSYYEHNRHEKGGLIISRIAAGESCCLVTDAGMPAISDPGEELVAMCHDSGIEVAVVPGPCAFVSALALSGMPAGRFTFEGFLSVNKQSRREHLSLLQNERRTMCFYEAPHKLKTTLADLADAFGDRRIALVRELTKIHEEVIRTTLFKACELYTENSPKGEFVLIIEGAPEQLAPQETLEGAVAAARLLCEGGMSINDAAKEISKKTKIKKGDIYKALTEEKDNG